MTLDVSSEFVGRGEPPGAALEGTLVERGKEGGRDGGWEGEEVKFREGAFQVLHGSFFDSGFSGSPK